jgi:hypothetical protein
MKIVTMNRGFWAAGAGLTLFATLGFQSQPMAQNIFGLFGHGARRVPNWLLFTIGDVLVTLVFLIKYVTLCVSTLIVGRSVTFLFVRSRFPW